MFSPIVFIFSDIQKIFRCFNRKLGILKGATLKSGYKNNFFYEVSIYLSKKATISMIYFHPQILPLIFR